MGHKGTPQNNQSNNVPVLPTPEHESFFGSGGMFTFGVLAAVLVTLLLVSLCICMMCRRKVCRSGFRVGVKGAIDRFNEKHAELKMEADVAMTPPVMLNYNNPFIMPNNYSFQEMSIIPVHALPQPQTHTNPFKNYSKSRLEE